jgi:peptidoglycan/LPS O-acetylase OafA/YrhL
MTIENTLRTIGALLIPISAVSTFTAQIIYFRRPDARLFGFGFGRYYYGEMRRTRPLLFAGSFGGILLAFVCFALANLLR